MNEKEILYTLALTRINYFNLAGIRQLYEAAGSATAIVENLNNIRDIVPDVAPKMLEGLRDINIVMPRAEAELRYCQQYDIQILALNDPHYPSRLRECDDAIKERPISTSNGSSTWWAPVIARPMDRIWYNVSWKN